MNKVLLLFATAVIFTGIMTAQQVSRIESVNGKQEKKIERASSERTNFQVIPENKAGQPLKFAGQPELVTNNGKVIKNPEKKPQTLPLNGIKVNGENNLRTDVTVKKSSRNDVATITLRVIGDPNAQWGYDNLGYQLLMDANATMLDDFDLFLDWFWYDWVQIYNLCEYTIPEELTGNLLTDPMILDSEGTITVPGGTYDIAFLLPYQVRLFTTYVRVNGYYYDSLFDDFEFKAGYEYLFQVEVPDAIDYNPADDVSLTKIILPPMSTELTDQEEVSVVLCNSGVNNVTGNLEFSFRVNEGSWTTAEIYNANLAPGAEITYTFTAKADFSTGGLYGVEAKVVYNLDMFTPNNIIGGYTKNPTPRELPFYEDFSEFDSLDEDWTFYQDNWLNWYVFYYDTWNMDADGGVGSLQIACPWPFEQDDPDYGPTEFYMVTDPMIMDEAGTYNISFWANPYGTNCKIKVLYGTTSDYKEMDVLETFTFNIMDHFFEWGIAIKNFEITTSGNYYFAIMFNSYWADGGDAMNIDNVKIDRGVFVGIPDITFNSGLGPVSSCNMTDGGIIGADVKNKGSEDIEVFTLTYQVNNGTVIEQTFNETIGYGKSKTVYFNTTADFSEIGDYTVNFTASTPNEVNTYNNETEIIIRHYVPVEELPYVTEIFNDWNPAAPGGWDKSWAGGWFAYWDVINGPPLLSRCFSLQPDVYRFTFEYTAGFMGWKDHFYVAYGKTGTDPYGWQIAKEFIDADTGDGIIIDEEFFMLEITEAGEYVFGFFPVKPEGDLCIFGATVEVAPEHDIKIKTIDVGSFARLTPSYQISGEKTFTAILQNKGKTANESGNIKVLHNNNELTSVNFAFTEMGETKNVVLKPVLGSIPAGQLALNFKATISGGITKEYDILKAVSDSTFAWDNIESGFFDGVGLNIPGGLGNIFELQKEDVLTSVTIGFWEHAPIGKKEFIFAVYNVDNNYNLGSMIFEEQHLRTEGNNTKGITFDIADITLPPGKYFFEVRQLDGTNIAIVYDDEWWGDGVIWINIPDIGIWGAESGFGYMHIRPNFSVNVGISSERVPSNQLTLYPNPSKGTVNVTMGETVMDKIVIYNAAGQIIQLSSVNNTSFRFDTEKLSSGIYFISVQTKTGIVNSKFVVR